MESPLPTVRVRRADGAVCIINESDYNKDKHTLVDENGHAVRDSKSEPAIEKAAVEIEDTSPQPTPTIPAEILVHGDPAIDAARTTPPEPRDDAPPEVLLHGQVADPDTMTAAELRGWLADRNLTAPASAAKSELRQMVKDELEAKSKPEDRKR